MRSLRNLARLSIMLIALFGASATATAPDSFDSCTNFIDTVPAVITTHGVFCVRHNLATNSTNVRAIEIDTDNVTIDCNGFKINGTGAGADTNSVGIFGDGVTNITVRHCTIQGFHDGINIDGTTAESGHLIEDNLLSLNRVNAMVVMGTGTIVRRNTVTNTGGNSGAITSFGIKTSGDVIDNVVDGFVLAFGVGEFQTFGIQTSGNGSLVQHNRVRNLVRAGLLPANGISISSGAGNEVRDNYVVQGASTSGFAITCNSAGRARDNVMGNYTTGLSTCSDDGGNASL